MQWHQLDSEHFSLWTDLDTEAARTTVRRLEDVRLALRAVSWRATDPPSWRLRVVAFRDADEWREAYGAERGGVAFSADFFGEPLIAFAAEESGASWRLVAHELAHRQFAEFVRRIPAWLTEGLACNLENLRIDYARGVAEAGGDNPRRSRLLHTAFRADWLRLVHADKEVARMGGREYAEYEADVWYLVRYLLDEKLPELGKLVDDLARGTDPDRAWNEVFGSMTEVKLAQEILDYRRKQSTHVARAPFQPWSGTTTMRSLPEADVHAIRAMLMVLHARGGNRSPPASVRAEIDAALRLDAGQPLAIVADMFVRGRVPVAQLRASAREAIRLHPGDWRGWSILALTFEAGNAEHERALAHAVELAPDDARLLNSLAWEHVKEGRGADAVPMAEKAVRLAPTDPDIVDTYAAVLAAAGRCAEARDWQQRAIELLPDAVTPPRLAEFRQRQSRYEAGCLDEVSTPAIETR